MRGVNEVRLLGNLGRDPEVRYQSNGQPVALLHVGTSDMVPNPDGGLVEETEWQRVRVTGSAAKYCAERLKSGSRVYIEGKNKARRWTEYKQDRILPEVKAHRVDGLANLKPPLNVPNPEFMPRTDSTALVDENDQE